jgi:hypothetical protein
LDHFGVVEVPDVQKDRDQKTYGRTVDLKCNTNLLIPLASRIDLDACHCDLKFAHPVARGPWVALMVDAQRIWERSPQLATSAVKHPLALGTAKAARLNAKRSPRYAKNRGPN